MRSLKMSVIHVLNIAEHYNCVINGALTRNKIYLHILLNNTNLSQANVSVSKEWNIMSIQS